MKVSLSELKSACLQMTVNQYSNFELSETVAPPHFTQFMEEVRATEKNAGKGYSISRIGTSVYVQCFNTNPCI